MAREQNEQRTPRSGAIRSRRRAEGPPPDRAPWRVEGQRDRPQEPRPERPRFGPLGGRGFWLMLLVLLALNWYIGGRISQEQERLDVPYTFFRTQVERGNVREVSTRG